MRVLVTGASGFIGRRFINLFFQDHELTCIVRRTDLDMSLKGVRWIDWDLSKPLKHESLPDHVDAIVHLVQANEPFPEGAEKLFSVNVASTLAMAEYGRKAGISRFVLASTGSVYAPGSAPFAESDPISPQGFYAETKNIAERLLRWYQDDFSVCILRLFSPYGPGQVGRMIPKIIDAVNHRRAVILTNEGQPLVNPVYVDDVVHLINRSLELEGHQVVNIAGPDIVNIREIAELVGKLLGMEPVFERKQQPFVSNLIGSTDKMHEIFPGIDCRRFSSGMREMMMVPSDDPGKNRPS